jgi:hypothetical protein
MNFVFFKYEILKLVAFEVHYWFLSKQPVFDPDAYHNLFLISVL